MHDKTQMFVLIIIPLEANMGSLHPISLLLHHQSQLLLSPMKPQTSESTTELERSLAWVNLVYLWNDDLDCKEYACRSIPKCKVICREDYADVWRVIQIMHNLSKADKCGSIKGNYEDNCLFIWCRAVQLCWWRTI